MTGIDSIFYAVVDLFNVQAIKAEQVLKKERDDLREVTLKLRNEEYEPLKCKEF